MSRQEALGGKREKRGHVTKVENELICQMRVFEASKNDDEAREIFNQLLAAYTGEVKRLAERIHRDFREDYDEAESAAWRHLADLIARYDPDKAKSVGVGLDDYINYYFRVKRTRKFIPRKGTGYYDRRLQTTNISEHVLRNVPDPSSLVFEEPIDIGAALDRLRDLVERLPEQCRYVLTRRYNLDGRGGSLLERVREEMQLRNKGDVLYLERKAFKLIREMAQQDEIGEILHMEPADISTLLDRLGDKPVGGRNEPFGRPGRGKAH